MIVEQSNFEQFTPTRLNFHFQLDKVRLTVDTHLKKKLEEHDAIGIPGKLEQKYCFLH
jgi:hypothetical protein